jgi:hypothetical protein
MLIPSTLYQLTVLLLLVLPGIVYAAVRRLLKGPSPEDRDFSVRLIRAIAVSVVLDCIYMLVAGPYIVRLARERPTQPVAPRGFAAHPRTSAVLALAFLVVIPVITGLAGQLRFARRPERRKPWWPLRVAPLIHPTPSGWDRAAPLRGNCFVRVFTDDGKWVGGWVGPDAFVSMYPEPRDIFIDVEWRMSGDGSFIEPVDDSLGLYVPLPGRERVAWIAAPETPD